MDIIIAYLVAFFVLPFFACNALWEQSFHVQTERQTVNVSYPEARNLSSDKWRPAIFTSCFHGLHKESAPCRNHPNLVYAEELLYPDFRIRLPQFIDEKHKRIWLKVLHYYRQVWRRGHVIEEYGYFTNQRGQNLVYANVTYNGQPTPGVWGDAACMAYGADLHVNAFPPWSGNEDAPAAIFVASPDDSSFQHFLDRVAVMLAQTRHLGPPESWKYITSRVRPDSPVENLWMLMVPGFHRLTTTLPAFAETRTRLLVYPCQAPLIHPWTQQLASEIIKLSAGVDPGTVLPISNRPLVLFMSRRTLNRGWANEIECRQAVAALLDSRDKSEMLLDFIADEYPSLKAVVQLGLNVKLMVGVHGGAFYNLAFMQPGTALVEICPVAPDHRSSRCGVMFWEMASTRDMLYWFIPATNSTAQWGINHLDCGLVVAAVQQALETQDAAAAQGLPTSPLEAFHQGSKFRRANRRRVR